MTVLYDLHSHTTASDGRLGPRDLVREAKKKHVTALAITDHDTVAGVDEATDEGRLCGVEVIPGIEVSATSGDRSVHILGLFIRHREAWLVEFFLRAERERVARVHRIVEKLAALGVGITADDVFRKSTHGTVGRPHVAEILLERGFVSSYAEAFDRYLGHRAPAYVGYDKLSTADAISLVRRAGGVPSLAHPGLLECDELLPQWVGEGLEAIEAYHSEHTSEATARYLALACEHDLLVTGGSDFHGIDGAGRDSLGCPELTAEAVESLRRRAVGRGA